MPVRAAYVPGPAAPAFAADAAAAGRVTVEAALDGVRKTQPIDTRAAVPDLAFSF